MVGDVPPRAQQPVAAVRPRPRLDHPTHEPVSRDCSLGVAQKQREEPHQVVGVPIAGRVRLAEADLAARCKATEERAVVDAERNRGTRAERPRCPVWQRHLEGSALEVRELAFEHRYGKAVDECAAGLGSGTEAALDHTHARTDPRPGTNGGLWWNGTLFSQRLRA